MDKKKVAKRIVSRIVADLSSRRGFRQEWEMIDADIQKEILKKWESIVSDEITTL